MFIAAFAVYIFTLSSTLVDSSSNYEPTYPRNCQEIDVPVGLGNRNLQGYISFQSSYNYDVQTPNCYCMVNLQTRPDYRLTLRFKKLRVDCYRGAYVNVTGKTKSNSYCGSYTDWPALYSSADFLNISYFHGNNNPGSWEGVELYYTAYHEGKCNNDDDDHDDNDDDHDDDDDEFSCWNNRCIPDDLKCDGRDNCGDWSDESMWTCGLTTGWIVAISVTCSVIGLLLIMCVACACMRSKQRKIRTDSTPGPSTAPMQANVEAAATGEVHGSMPMPPPYTYINNMVVLNPGPEASGAVGSAWAAIYGDKVLHDGLPPHYDDVTETKDSKTDDK